MPTIQSTFTNKFGYFNINSNVKGVLLYNRDSLFFDSGDIVENVTYKLNDHSLGYYPIVQSLDGNLKVTYPQVTHSSVNSYQIATVSTVNLYTLHAQSATNTQSATGTETTVTHNLGYYPLVHVLDSDGNVLWNTQITHNDVNSFTVSLLSSQSFTVVYTSGSTTKPSISGTSTSIVHNLGRYPCVQVMDSAGNIVPATIQHTNLNTFVVSSVEALSGAAIYI